MADPSTTTVMAAQDSLMSTAAAALVPALVIAWARHEPDRIGEVAFFEDDHPHTLGRAGGSGRRVHFCRQRPGHSTSTGELNSGHLSRDQLEIRRDGLTLRLRRLGRAALRLGGEPVHDAVARPGDVVVLERALLLYCALRPANLPASPTALDAPDFGAADLDGLVGESAEAWRLRQRIAWCATAEGHLLLTGPSGAGKAPVAAAIHRLSRGAGPRVERNAATLPDEALAEELFGRADPETAGAVARAQGGTLVLDTLSRVSTAAQTHLLDVLDSGRYRPAGAAKARTADVRIIGVSNRGLAGLEPDFIARFPLRLDVPGLDARRADVPLIARHLLSEMARAQPALFPDGPPRLHPRLAEALMRRRYTGHVRELAQVLWAAVEAWSAGGRGKYLDAVDEPASKDAPSAPAPAPTTDSDDDAPHAEVDRDAAKTLDRTTALRLWPSLDGESCRAALVFGDDALTLPPRASHLVLLAVARERLADRARDLPESEQGWMYAEVLADALALDRQRLNTEVYRARKQVEKLGIDGADLLFERRPQTRQVRLGLTRITIDEPGG